MILNHTNTSQMATILFFAFYQTWHAIPLVFTVFVRKIQTTWKPAEIFRSKLQMDNPPVLVIAIWDEWWEDWESGTYPINSGMSRVFYLPQHRTLSTRHPLALRRMRSTGCWVSADERWYWKFLGSPPRVWTPAFSATGRRSTTRPLSCDHPLHHFYELPALIR